MSWFSHPDLLSNLGLLRRKLQSSVASRVLGPLYRLLMPKSVRARIISRGLRAQHGNQHEVDLFGETIVFSTKDEYSIRWFYPHDGGGIAHEPVLTRHFARKARRADGILDIGANVGWFTCIGAVLSDGRVYSFEMDKDNVDRLQLNVELNNQVEKTQVEQLAVTDHGEKTSYSKTVSGGSPKYRLSAQDDKGADAEVSSTTVDAYCQNHVEALDLIKIDVEGAELKVLRGAIETVRRLRPDLYVEIHPERLRKNDDSVQEMLTLLRENGYSVHEFVDFRQNYGGEKGLREIDPSSGYSPKNISLLYAKKANKKNG